MRVLTLVNSYPSVHSPSGAAYVTARVAALAARSARVDGDVDNDTLALVPRYSAPVQRVRRVAGLHDDAALRLRPDAPLTECLVPWHASDVVAVRTGRLPGRLVRRAARRVEDAVAEWVDVDVDDEGCVVADGGSSRSYDVLHAHGMYALPAGGVAALVAEGRGVPFVVSMHGSDVTEVMARAPEAYSAILRRAAATIYVSESLRRQAVGLGAPAENSHVIPNGVDPGVFTPQRDGSVRSSEGVDAPPRLLFVGNLLPVKGADRLPAILDAVRSRHPEATLDVVGSGAGRSALSGLPGVRLHGRLEPPEVAAAMRAASVLVVPSRAEGWGCVATEAYACGTPVVASAVGGLTESVEQGGQVDATDDAALAARFAEAIERIRSRDGRGLPEERRVRSWDTVVTEELAVLQAAVREARR